MLRQVYSSRIEGAIAEYARAHPDRAWIYGASLPWLSDRVAYDETLYTDEARAYKPLKAIYHHESVNHSAGEYVRGKAHTNAAPKLCKNGVGWGPEQSSEQRKKNSQPTEGDSGSVATLATGGVHGPGLRPAATPGDSRGPVFSWLEPGCRQGEDLSRPVLN